ncbi:hypothetical protein GCM10022419_121270 [Nonomuraea rosea]|uniref:PPE domain-containing protein n=1 Tax=Nonomuraea rosea TaxID=638574 RepID=A0ABP6ZS54_9ACTN
MSNPQEGSAGQPTGQQPNAATTYGGLPVTAQAPLASSGISFKPGGLDAVSGRIEMPKGLFGTLQGRSDEMGVPAPGFGVIGIGLTTAHDKAIAAQSSALARGKNALDSWREALKKADANYTEAENPPGPGDDGKPGPELPGPGPEMPGIPDPELPGPDPVLPGPDPVLPGPDPELPGPDPELPSSDLPENGAPATDIPGTNLPKNDVPTTDLPTDLPRSDVPTTDLPGTDPLNVSSPDTKVPDIDAALNRPSDKTDLSSYNPNNPQLNGPLNPDGPNANTRSGTTLGTPSGGGGGPANASGMRLPGVGAAGNMGSGMPMMPMMPMTGASNEADERDRQESLLLAEDEGVWDGDEDIAPAVIGKEK